MQTIPGAFEIRHSTGHSLVAASTPHEAASKFAAHIGRCIVSAVDPEDPTGPMLDCEIELASDGLWPDDASCKFFHVFAVFGL